MSALLGEQNEDLCAGERLEMDLKMDYFSLKEQ